jgi:hypothetical protein
LSPNVYIIGGGLPVDLAEVMPLQCITCIFNIVFYIKRIIVEKMRSARRYAIVIIINIRHEHTITVKLP